MKSVLTMKHWQLFLLMIGIPLFVSIGSLLALYAEIMSEWSIILMFFASIAIVFLTIIWHYILVINLIPHYPPGVPFKNLTLFRYSVFAPLVFLALLIVSLIYVIAKPSALTGVDLRFFWIFFPLIGLMCVANLYCIYKTAEALVTVELQRKATSGDCIVEFILILYFWIIGIWFLQPRINRIFSNEGQIPNLPPIPDGEFV